MIAKAPSNIALIKYMGKEDSSLNIPSNGSLSLTLNRLCSFAELRLTRSESCWLPEFPAIDRALWPTATVPQLSGSGIDRILKHVERTQRAMQEIFPRFGIPLTSDSQSFELRTANTFPASAGIASSASSFAAVTLAAAAASAQDPKEFEIEYLKTPELRRALAAVSRQGSGSSCRSFEGPWVIWEGERAVAVEAKVPAMTDFVLMASAEAKAVGSSEAHLRVRTSPLWEGRPERVTRRLRDLESALQKNDWDAVSRIAWSESWEMHSLFHTCADPFTYWEPVTLEILRWITPFVTGAAEAGVSRPIVTLDAGPNVHVIVPTTQADLWEKRFQARFPNLPRLRDEQGAGASFVEAGLK